jgi:hypothetical protein
MNALEFNFIIDRLFTFQVVGGAWPDGSEKERKKKRESFRN